MRGAHCGTAKPLLLGPAPQFKSQTLKCWAELGQSVLRSLPETALLGHSGLGSKAAPGLERLGAHGEE